MLRVLSFISFILYGQRCLCAPPTKPTLRNEVNTEFDPFKWLNSSDDTLKVTMRMNNPRTCDITENIPNYLTKILGVSEGINSLIYKVSSDYSLIRLTEDNALIWKSTYSDMKCVSFTLFKKNDTVQHISLEILHLHGMNFERFYERLNGIWAEIAPTRFSKEILKLYDNLPVPVTFDLKNPNDPKFLSRPYDSDVKSFVYTPKSYYTVVNITDGEIGVWPRNNKTCGEITVYYDNNNNKPALVRLKTNHDSVHAVVYYSYDANNQKWVPIETEKLDELMETLRITSPRVNRLLDYLQFVLSRGDITPSVTEDQFLKALEPDPENKQPSKEVVKDHLGFLLKTLELAFDLISSLKYNTVESLKTIHGLVLYAEKLLNAVPKDHSNYAKVSRMYESILSDFVADSRLIREKLITMNGIINQIDTDIRENNEFKKNLESSGDEISDDLLNKIKDSAKKILEYFKSFKQSYISATIINSNTIHYRLGTYINEVGKLTRFVGTIIDLKSIPKSKDASTSVDNLLITPDVTTYKPIVLDLSSPDTRYFTINDGLDKGIMYKTFNATPGYNIAGINDNNINVWTSKDGKCKTVTFYLKRNKLFLCVISSVINNSIVNEYLMKDEYWKEINADIFEDEIKLLKGMESSFKMLYFIPTTITIILITLIQSI